MALAENLQCCSNEASARSPELDTSFHPETKTAVSRFHAPDGGASLVHKMNQQRKREQPNFQIPFVDFSKYLHGTAEERTQCVSEIMKGFTSSGFLYLANSGLSPKSAYTWSEKYFALPTAEKTRHPNNSSAGNRGYSGLGIEKVTNLDLETGGRESVQKLRAALPDIKESLEIGSDPGPRYPVKPFINYYPTALPGFEEAMRTFYEQCDDLHEQLLSAIAIGLNLEPSFFQEYIRGGDHVLRLLHYPTVPKTVLEQEGAVRAGAHTDYGTVTLLFQDGSGGLQVRTPEGKWMDVPPIEGAIVINAADMLQIWTNDVIKSTHHRVVSPPDAPTTEDGMFSARYAIAYFGHPDHDRLVSTIETCFDEARPKKYSPMMPEEWIVKRLASTY